MKASIVIPESAGSRRGDTSGKVGSFLSSHSRPTARAEWLKRSYAIEDCSYVLRSSGFYVDLHERECSRLIQGVLDDPQVAFPPAVDEENARIERWFFSSGSETIRFSENRRIYSASLLKA
jgi:hypothetical protein